MDEVFTETLAPVSLDNLDAIISWNLHGYPAGVLFTSGSRALQMLKTSHFPVSIVTVPVPVFGIWLSLEQLCIIAPNFLRAALGSSGQEVTQ